MNYVDHYQSMMMEQCRFVTLPLGGGMSVPLVRMFYLYSIELDIPLQNMAAYPIHLVNFTIVDDESKTEIVNLITAQLVFTFPMPIRILHHVKCRIDINPPYTVIAYLHGYYI
jgi:hypothetical protein